MLARRPRRWLGNRCPSVLRGLVGMTIDRKEKATWLRPGSNYDCYGWTALRRLPLQHGFCFTLERGVYRQRRFMGVRCEHGYMKVRAYSVCSRPVIL